MIGYILTFFLGLFVGGLIVLLLWRYFEEAAVKGKLTICKTEEGIRYFVQLPSEEVIRLTTNSHVVLTVDEVNIV